MPASSYDEPIEKLRVLRERLENCAATTALPEMEILMEAIAMMVEERRLDLFAAELRNLPLPVVPAESLPTTGQNLGELTQTALRPDHPMMKAWNEFCATDEFKSALRWAVENKYDDGRPINDIQREQHAKGSMWLAFTKGMECREGS